MYGYFENGKRVGFLSLALSDDTMKINDIAILPEYQKNGFGSELLQFSKEEAKKRGCEKIRLGMVDDNIELKRWYEKHGFKTVELIHYATVTYTAGKMECIL